MHPILCFRTFFPNSIFARGAFVALLAASSGVALAAPESQPVLAVSGGRIRGRALTEGEGYSFRGVPFAQPPVGDLRWREPQPVLPWSGIREADKPGAPAAQLPAGWNNDAAAASSEDCLYLDVWTPTLDASAKKPVMVWIHGGANLAGAGGADPLYHGASLIKHGVVLVVIEYRLGIFGFFAHPELTRESLHHVSGNYAILDQIAALQWVRDNIQQFGGDPQNVTVFGQSAGSMDISSLLTSPLAAGLFQRAIAESGPMPGVDTPTLAQAERAGEDVAKKLHVEGATVLASLRGLPTAELLKEGQNIHNITIDGYVFHTSPAAAYAHGEEAKVPLMIGFNAIELSASGTPDQLRATVQNTFHALAPRALELYGLSEGKVAAAPADPVYGSVADRVGSDFFCCTSVVQGEWHRAAGNMTWEYEFARARPPQPHVTHSGELAYVFGNLLPTGSQPGEYTDADRKLSNEMQTYWTNFAKTGNPNGTGLPDWPAYDGKARDYLQFTAEAEIRVAKGPRAPLADLYRERLAQAVDGTSQ